jgi:hypothetical protein
LQVGERYRPRPGADEVLHKLDFVGGWPLSASAVREVHSVLSGAFKQALGWGWIAHNPVKQATAPPPAQPECRDPTLKVSPNCLKWLGRGS